jgi:gamma-glutamyltranspeptidase / glutathione hydrolase
MAGMGFQSAASIHHQAEAKRLAFEDRARFFADPDFSRAPLEWLNSPEYARERARLIRPDRLMRDVKAGRPPSPGDTTYFTTADADGMMVSWIQSNYRGMGSGLVPDGLGFMFQDRGELFDLTPGRPNSYAPGKRPFQTIIPGFAVRGGEPWLSFGVMGGDMQPQGHVQVLVNLLDFGMDVQQAGEAPRVEHVGSATPTGRAGDPRGGTVLAEIGLPDEVVNELARRGHRVERVKRNGGGYQGIWIDRKTGVLHGGTEARKDGAAVGY